VTEASKPLPYIPVNTIVLLVHVCIVATNACYLHHVVWPVCICACISTCSTGWISLKFDIKDFSENLTKTPYLVKIRHLTWRPKYVFLLPVTCNSAVHSEGTVAFRLQQWLPQMHHNGILYIHCLACSLFSHHTEFKCDTISSCWHCIVSIKHFLWMLMGLEPG
jgi:hypothetical protein